MIATGIISVFAVTSLATSSIVTFIARKFFFPEKLEMGNIVLLTAIFAATASIVFVSIYPLDFSGKRKDGK